MTGYKLGNVVERKTSFVVQFRKPDWKPIDGWFDYKTFDTEDDAMELFNAKWDGGLDVRVVKTVRETSTIAVRQT